MKRILIAICLVASVACAESVQNVLRYVVMTRRVAADTTIVIEVSTNCIAQYRMTTETEVNGGFYRDYSGYGNHATQSVAACRGTWVSDGDGSVQLDGLTNYFILPQQASICNTALTVMAWMYARSATNTMHGDAYIVRSDISGSAYGFILYGVGTALTAYFSSSGSDLPVQATASAAITINEWHHICCTFSEGGDGKARVYVDGVLLASSINADTDGFYGPTNMPITVGQFTDYDSNRFAPCSFDDVRVYNIGLTSNEVYSIVTNTVGRY